MPDLTRRTFLRWTAGAATLLAISPIEAARILERAPRAGLLRLEARAAEPGLRLTVALVDRASGRRIAERTYDDLSTESTLYEIVLDPDQVDEIDLARGGVDLLAGVGDDVALVRIA